MNIGSAIKTCRISRNMTQDTLAGAAKISTSYLSLIERGKRSPNVSVVERIAKAMGISPVLLTYMADPAGRELLEHKAPALAGALSHASVAWLRSQGYRLKAGRRVQS